MSLPCLVINGPTASGKTAAAVGLAQQLLSQGQPAEVINADSMLVYRGMDIGTAKPTMLERGGVPHHLIDILTVTETASVAEFQSLARAAITDCRRRGVVPIIAGGSALYMRAILDVFEFPGTDPVIRAKWEAKCVEMGPEALYEELRRLAPQAADGILPGNARRIVRALEVIELTGSFKSTLPTWTYHVADVQQYGLYLEREELDRRIELRVERMWEQGFVAEVESLLPHGLRSGLTASRALGYRQILAYLDGELTEEQAQDATIRGTRRFARKQEGWFKRDSRIQWVPAGEAAVRQIAETAFDTGS